MPRKRKLRFKTIFISDVHLGVAECKAAQASHFLRNSICEKLVMNGDIIDAWALQRGGKWTKPHTHFVRTVLRKMEKENIEVIYTRGNHDDVLERFLPIVFDNLQIVQEHIHESPHGNYLVVHGDGFDHVTTNHKWMAKLGSVGYDTLLKLNRAYNAYRHWRGKEPFSFAKWVKAKVKGAVSFVGKFEEQLQELAKSKNCTGIICGHIHTPADKKVGDVHYINSGDWVESMTAIVEHLDRTFEVITYEEWCRRSNREPKGILLNAPSAELDESDDDARPVNAPAPAPAPVSETAAAA
jgi:UDP-2,3-diacylglucosamine pyrophosphatase LpxH